MGLLQMILVDKPVLMMGDILINKPRQSRVMCWDGIPYEHMGFVIAPNNIGYLINPV